MDVGYVLRGFASPQPSSKPSSPSPLWRGAPQGRGGFPAAADANSYKIDCREHAATVFVYAPVQGNDAGRAGLKPAPTFFFQAAI
ncbi:MAG: hypothetical protein LBM98_13555 [Oscillospiraceae bacterium]|nr:hypothetical protein [Oscillospiraceae bacterium]